MDDTILKLELLFHNYRCNCTILTLTEAPDEEDGSFLLGARTIISVISYHNYHTIGPS